jgi:hypothetical protein
VKNQSEQVNSRTDRDLLHLLFFTIGRRFSAIIIWYLVFLSIFY